VAEVYEHCDAAAHAFALVHQLWAVAGKDGLDAASAALVEATVHLAAAYHEYVTVGEYVANQAAIAVETAARKVDASFRAIEALQQVPRVAYALLRGPLLAGADHPDVPCALRMLWDTLPPHELAPALYPRLSSWISPDEVSFPRHSLSKAALALSRQPIYLLDSYDTLTVYYTAAARAAGVPFPPPAGSRLRAHVRQLQQMRRITPRLLVLCEGEEGPEKAFSKWLIEDDVAARAQGSLTGGAFVQFLQQIEGLVGELLQRGR